MFFGGADPRSYERSPGETGFELELWEVREAFDPRYGVTQTPWVIARKPDGEPRSLRGSPSRANGRGNRDRETGGAGS
jgi:hypothetical protein